MSCKLYYICDKKWEELDGTGQDGIRFCDRCEKNVFLIHNEEEFDRNKELGRCVAFAQDYEFDDAVEHKKLSGVMGDPDGTFFNIIKRFRDKK